jgi:fatty-acyl-CoA synthase
MTLIEGSIGDILRRNAGERGDATALLWPNGEGLARMTYRELLARAETGAQWLLEHVQPGDRVAIWSCNTLEYAVLLHAIALAGVIVAPCNTAWTDAELLHALGRTAPALVFAGPTGRGGVLIDRAEQLASVPVIDLSSFFTLGPNDGHAALPELNERSPYLIQFTSGTTGRAKGALLSHKAAVLGGWLRAVCEGSDETDVWLNPVPYHHIGGTCAVGLAALGTGGSYVVLPRFDPDQLVSLMSPVGATRMGGVPTMWHDLLQRPDLPATSTVRSVVLGGASVPPSLVEGVRARLGAMVAIGYGQSECPIITATLPEDDLETLVETVGRPLPHMEVKIADPKTGVTLACGEVGELLARGPLVMDGYWGDAEATSAAIDGDGFLHTGDLASMAEDGVCRIHGRAREVIIRGGENIYPIEVEDALLRHPSVAGAAVIGIPDERLGQRVAAVVKLRDGFDADPAGLEAHAAQFLARFKTPQAWRFVDAFPLTASGKIRKVELATLFDQAETATA